MNTIDWQRAEEAFHRVLDAPPEERPALVAQLPDDLRSAVESLLNAGATEDRISRAIQGAATLVSQPSMAGAYRLVKQIGEGGMGAVYLAVRADNAFDKKVAVKFVRRGMESALLRQRFDAERRILAKLEHPCIARLLDAGQTPEGLPYLVMEYVEGSTIVEYAQAAALSVRERVDLFLKVCGAVQYAHQNLVIHRDLKPGNVMIDGGGTPKLLDFGIAKLLDSEGTQSPSATAVRLLTPDYASPEQMRGEPAGIASDIYSLGAVLYELLAGSPPFRLAGLSAAEAERAVTTGALEKPSQRNLNFHRQLRGDLDNIVLMAMRKEPRERYGSAADLAADLERYLEGRPVEARDYRPWERAWKFTLRHRVSSAAACAVLLSLTTGMVMARRAAIRAERQRLIAVAERQKAEASARVAEEQRAIAVQQAGAAAAARDIAESRYTNELNVIQHMLGGVADIHSFAGTNAARLAALEKAVQSLEHMAAESPGDARVRFTLATAYERLGHLLARDMGGPGRFDRGIELLKRARERYQGLLQEQYRGLSGRPSLDLLAEVVETSMDLGCALSDVVDDPHAVDVFYAETTRWGQEMRRLYPASERSQYVEAHASSCRILTSMQRNPGKADPQEIAAMRR